MQRLLLLLLVIAFTQACEGPAKVDLSPAEPTLVVDAFINNQEEAQRITLNFSQNFLDNTPYLPAEGAIVSLTNVQTGTVLRFGESTESGNYVWQPSAQQPTIGNVGEEFTLRIAFEGQVYTATSRLNRTTTVDEIVFFEETVPFSQDKYWEARINASDLEGLGDSYWIKTYWNDAFLQRPGEINVAYDAGRSEGNPIDGQSFIFPIRIGINPTGEDESYKLNDKVRVEIHSISNQAFDYFTKLQIQTDRPGGFSELFSQPLANLPTNISVENNSVIKVLGYFSVSAVETKEVVFTEDLIRE